MGFFLLKHEVAYPKDNILTFYSLYRHTAKMSDYQSSGEEILALTKSADKFPVMIREDNKIVAPLPDGLALLIRKYQDNKTQFDEVVWYKDANGVEHKPKTGKPWKIFNRSYETLIDHPISGIPLLIRHNLDTLIDTEVALSKPIAIKAGEELGLMGEYNQMGESGEKLLHLEVFTYDDIDQFKAKAEVAYKQDKEKKGIKDNFLYVPRDSRLYSIMNDEAFELEQTQVEIMVPLADVEKRSIKDKQNPKQTKTYYNVQPYLYQQVEHSKDKDSGIYVDDRHVTHGVLFPGVNVFTQSGSGLCIFKNPLHQTIDPESELTIEQKNELDPMFKAIMAELNLEADKGTPIKFEAGKLKDLLLNPIQQRRLMGIIAKHDSEWKKTKSIDFKQVCDVYRDNGKNDVASGIEKRVEDLSIKLEADGFNSDKQAYYMHPLGVIGWLMPYSTCFCHRDFTVEEVKNIVSSLRGSKPYKLFTHKKCPLEDKEKSYEKLTELLNNTFKKYEINTCIRKIHFLTQVYLESAHLTTTVEFASGADYDLGKHPSAIKNQNIEVGDGPRYKGRGLMQLTWRKNYLSYFKYTRLDPEYYETVISPITKLEDMANRKNSFHSLIGEKLFLAVDSAGWYWRYGSVWGDLNILADNDDIYAINIGVNGGFNDFETRINWAKKIIKNNNIKNCPNLNLLKELGKYNFSTSSVRNKGYGKKYKAKFESYDD
ncbi:glycoside hydrolase family 19 [Rodentibacter sp. Ppn85]|uniref:glycoside hydrolase family 19 protein n=1 Tax=Rodentibacter sp. Ppn85 TaxID=1908525 RepID=UPI001E342EDC|nr:glycoside hydrolase family 19 [Rodentibacter sp. Ppn85]